MTEPHRDHHQPVAKRHYTGTDTPVVPMPFGPTNGSVIVVPNDCILMGWSLMESTGAAACEVDLFDGAGNAGRPIAFVSLQQGQSTRDTLSSWGLAVQTQLSVVMASGSAKGVLWVILP